MNPQHALYCMHVCVIITVSVWPWWQIFTLSCTLDTIHVQSIFWLILIYFCYRCHCPDLFPIIRGIYHTSNLPRLPAERRKERRGGGGTAGSEIEREGRWRGSVKAGLFFSRVHGEVVRRECMWARRMIMWHDTSEMRAGLPWQRRGGTFSPGAQIKQAVNDVWLGFWSGNCSGWPFCSVCLGPPILFVSEHQDKCEIVVVFLCWYIWRKRRTVLSCVWTKQFPSSSFEIMVDSFGR